MWIQLLLWKPRLRVELVFHMVNAGCGVRSAMRKAENVWGGAFRSSPGVLLLPVTDGSNCAETHSSWALIALIIYAVCCTACFYPKCSAVQWVHTFSLWVVQVDYGNSSYTKITGGIHKKNVPLFHIESSEREKEMMISGCHVWGDIGLIKHFLPASLHPKGELLARYCRLDSVVWDIWEN